MSRFDSFTVPQGDDEPLDGGQSTQQEEGELDEPQLSAVDKLAEKFQQGLAQANQQNSVSAQLLSDPNIQAYLKGMREGKKIKLVEDAPAAIEEPEGDPTDMDNTALVDFTLKKVSARLESQLGKLFEPFQAKLDQLESLAAAMQGSNVTREIEAVKAKYSDFDQHRDSMKELSKATGGSYPIEKLYRMAKALAGEEAGQIVNPSSELPTQMGSRTQSSQQRRTRQNQDPSAFRGKAGFSNLISQAQALSE